MESKTWGKEAFNKNTLVEVIKPLPPRVKQAFYAASNKGIVARRTWDGCAYNAGAAELGLVANSYTTAAKAFDIPEHLVVNFIRVWDRHPGSDDQATEDLRQAILQVGLFTEPGETSARRILRQTIYKAQEAQMQAELEALIESTDITDAQNSFAMDMSKAGELLSV